MVSNGLWTGQYRDQTPHLVPQNVGQRELVGAGNLLVFTQLLPVGNDRLPISGVKSPQISHNAGCEQNVSGDVDKAT